MTTAPSHGAVGFYHPAVHQSECGQRYSATETECVALVVKVNDDDSLNLCVWRSDGVSFVEWGVPTEDNADDGVAYFAAK